MIDCVWWIWQNLHPNTAFGAKGISDTGTFLNTPPSVNKTLETPIDLGYTWEGVLQVKDLMSTTAVPCCYIYLWDFIREPNPSLRRRQQIHLIKKEGCL